MAAGTLSTRSIDVVTVWHAYLLFRGDLAKTAAAVGLDAPTVGRLAREHDWESKLRDLGAMTAGSSQGVQVQLNRAVNYITGSYARKVLEMAFSRITEETIDDWLEETTDKGGKRKSAKGLLDLTRALQASQEMTSRALGDDHAAPAGPDGGRTSLGIDVMRALDALDTRALDSVALVRESLAPAPEASNLAQDVLPLPLTPENPAS